jgi:hypothetical protein
MVEYTKNVEVKIRTKINTFFSKFLKSQIQSHNDSGTLSLQTNCASLVITLPVPNVGFWQQEITENYESNHQDATI